MLIIVPDSNAYVVYVLQWIYTTTNKIWFWKKKLCY